MRIHIRHTTRYSFGDGVTYGLQQLRITPKTRHQQHILSWSIEIEGGRKELAYEDQHNNLVDLVSVNRGATELVATSEGTVDTDASNGVVGRHPGPAPLWLYTRHTPRTKPGPGVRALVKEAEGATDLERLHGLMAAVGDRVAYTVGASQSDWDAETAIAEGHGVCQDHTHIYLACTREMGFAARYVSGYLMLNDTVTQDAMHAWAEVHIDELGWVGFDVSNGISPDARYIRVATGLDYAEAAPVTGSRMGGAQEALNVQIEVAQQ